jgi:PPOX class probable FMN-dependent enzyme
MPPVNDTALLTFLNFAPFMTPHPFGKTVDTIEQLREILPPPSGISVIKVLDHMDEHVQTFIRCSPYALIATSSRHGTCDASPRGGEPGFVKILDDRHLLLPEASGNRRADTIENLLENPQIGMLFLVPGYEETLRLNGRVVVTRDPELLRLADPGGNPPLVGLGIMVEECFLHCAKAAMRSSIWNPMGWPDLEEFPSAAEIFRSHTGSKLGNVKDIQSLLDESYTNRL